MGRATLIMVASVLLSRIMGFVREAVIAALLGANAKTDVYFSAFTIPDFLNHILAGGALSITFIPIFSRFLADKEEAKGWRLTSVVLSNMTLLAIPAILLLEIFAEELVPLVGPGFSEAQAAECAYLVRVILPAQYFFYTGGILMAVQYAHERFLLPALAPIVYNLGIIAGGAILAPYIGIEGFCWGVLFGAFAGNLGLQILGARKIGFRFRLEVALRDPGFIEFLKLSLPMMLGFSLILVDEWIGKALASYLISATISWLTYARTLMRVPIAILGQAAGVASYPFLARLAAEGKLGELEATLGRALRNVLLYIVPASALCAVLGREMAMILFGRGKFTPADAVAVGETLFYFSLGIFAWGAQAILSRGFYALRDTITPTVVGTIFTGLVLPVSYVLMDPMEHRGLALGSSVGIISYAICLYWLFHRRMGASRAAGEAARTASHFFKLMVAGAGMAAAIYGVLQVLGDALPWQRAWGSLARCFVGGAVGLAVFALLAMLLRVEGLSRIWLRLRRLLPARTG
jgi:putative peptidoglycan lipid II flippase